MSSPDMKQNNPSSILATEHLWPGEEVAGKVWKADILRSWCKSCQCIFDGETFVTGGKIPIFISISSKVILSPRLHWLNILSLFLLLSFKTSTIAALQLSKFALNC